MIANVVEFKASADVLETRGMQGFRDRVLPVLQAQPGFTGYLVMMSREQGKLLGITLWDSEEHGRLARARLEEERQAGAEELQAQSPAPLQAYEVLARQ